MDLIVKISEYRILNNSVENILVALLVFLLVLLSAEVLKRTLNKGVANFVKKSSTRFDDIFFDYLIFSINIGSWFIALITSKSFLTLSEKVDKISKNIFIIIITVIVTWIINKLILDLIEQSFNKVSKDLSKSFLPFLKNFVKIFVWLIGTMFILSNLGITIASIGTALGIGGLAIALAVKPTLEAFFASIAIFADKAFVVGDIIKIKEYTGTVKKIGLRTTIIQTYQGTEMIIPNMDFTTNEIENITKREGQRIDSKISLMYETNNEKIKTAIKIIQTILQDNEHVGQDIRVWFDSFGDYALMILITYFIDSRLEYVDRIAVISNINLAIKEQLEKESIHIAFPTNIVHIRKD